ncbi:MAG: MHYT domain-containing protein [Hyphomonadaceae bacterium]
MAGYSPHKNLPAPIRLEPLLVVGSIILSVLGSLHALRLVSPLRRT